MEEELLGTDLRMVMEARPEYLGFGMDIVISTKGDLGMASGRDNLAQAIFHRLLTRRGELAELGHPEYGSRLHELIGEPNDDETRDIIRLYVKECLMQEYRVKEIVKIDVKAYKDNPSAVILDMVITPIKSIVPMNLVFPYYLEVS